MCTWVVRAGQNHHTTYIHVFSISESEGGISYKQIFHDMLKS